MAFFVVGFLLPAAARRSFSAFCCLTRTHVVFLLSDFRLRQLRVAYFQLFAACRLRTAFFVVSYSLPASARRSFSAFCRLTRTHGVFCCQSFASGFRASFVFSFLPPDAYARRFLVVSLSLPPATRRSFSAFFRLMLTHGVRRC